ncbi:substrate-binding domain-containing protein [Candidatus Viridilinea mediisalina]|uniref:PBP domain-containing protein n=1 Tax=Candidatus Viridilinea mediisalina TaxID=2024553 RepID=A0A2A6RMS9_9CHLR|nr:substrate-binding domain-containing protein [Candidatus Viridilinea mediisalina]PDW04226.1 hypothetical protein CJ255_04555 [Candidatus Viridilinea mediisalina]
MRSLAHILSFVLLLSLVACSSPLEPAPELVELPTTTLTFAGSGAGTVILRHVLAPFEREYGIRLEFLVSSGGQPALRGAQAGEFDVAVLLTDNPAGISRPGLTLINLAKDPVVFLRHADLPISGLSSEQLRAIYLGSVTNWAELGGPNLPIVVLTRNEDDAATRILRHHLFGTGAWPPMAIVFSRSADLREAVQRTPGSIGFDSYGAAMINGMAEQVLTVDELHPGALAQAGYPLPPRRLVLAYPTAQREALAPLLTYVQSEAARHALALQGLVPNE